MNKKILVLAAVLVLAGSLQAVDLGFGVKGGLSLSNSTWNNDDGSEKFLLRPTFGAFAVFPINEKLSVQPEVSYLMVGESWTETEGVTEWKVVETLNYIHVPVLFKYRLARGGKFVPFLFAGPSVGLLLSAHNEYHASDEALDRTENIKGWFRSIDFGVDLGVGAEKAMGRLKFLIDLRYYLGLADVYGFAVDYLKNNALTLTAGVGF